LRVIYFAKLARGEIWMLTIYGKNVQENIPAHVLRAMRKACSVVSVRTLQDWEQGRREPSAAAKTLIKIAELYPHMLKKVAA
jgi:putative transcriptional regulator